MSPFKASLFFGVAMFITSIVLQFVNPVDMDNLMEGFMTPVLAFEFMNSASETAALFNVEAPGIYRNDFMLGNTVDYLFMFFYSVFLGFTALGIIRETGIKILWIAVLLSVLIFFFDLLENVTMASIVAAYFNGDELVDSFYGNLQLFTWLKWGSLSAVFLLFSGYFVQRKTMGKIIVFLTLINFGLAVSAFFNRSVLNELMALSVVLLFLLLFIHNVMVRPSTTSEEVFA